MTEPEEEAYRAETDAIVGEVKHQAECGRVAGHDFDVSGSEDVCIHCGKRREPRPVAPVPPDATDEEIVRRLYNRSKRWLHMNATTVVDGGIMARLREREGELISEACKAWLARHDG